MIIYKIFLGKKVMLVFHPFMHLYAVCLPSILLLDWQHIWQQKEQKDHNKYVGLLGLLQKSISKKWKKKSMTSNQDESSFVFSKMDQNIVYQQNEQNTVIRWDWQIAHG